MIDYKKHLTVQSYGTQLCVFINGKNDEETYGIWLSLFNAGCTGDLESEPERVNDSVFSFWTTPEKLLRYFVTRNLFRLSNDPDKDARFEKQAEKLGLAEFNSIPRDSYRSANVIPDEYCFGQISAAKPDADFSDKCWEYAMSPK